MEHDVKRDLWDLFQNNPLGQRVLEHLSTRFYDTSIYTRGDPYDTTYKLGQRDVITYIINSCATAQIKPTENDND